MKVFTQILGALLFCAWAALGQIQVTPGIISSQVSQQNETVILPQPVLLSGREGDFFFVTALRLPAGLSVFPSHGQFGSRPEQLWISIKPSLFPLGDTKVIVPFYDGHMYTFLEVGLTVLPGAEPGQKTLWVPHFAYGSGWSTEFILTGAKEKTSVLFEFFSPAGQPKRVTAAGSINGRPTLSRIEVLVQPDRMALLILQNMGPNESGSAKVTIPAGSGIQLRTRYVSYDCGGNQISQAVFPVPAPGNNIVLPVLYYPAGDAGLVLLNLHASSQTVVVRYEDYSMQRITEKEFILEPGQQESMLLSYYFIRSELGLGQLTITGEGPVSALLLPILPSGSLSVLVP